MKYLSSWSLFFLAVALSTKDPTEKPVPSNVSSMAGEAVLTAAKLALVNRKLNGLSVKKEENGNSVWVEIDELGGKSDGRQLVSLNVLVPQDAHTLRRSLVQAGSIPSATGRAIIATISLLEQKHILLDSFDIYVSLTRGALNASTYNVLVVATRPSFSGGHLIVVLDSKFRLIKIIKGM